MARIDSYGFGHVVVDGVEYDRDVIILPGRVVPEWWRRDGHSLIEADLAEVADELPGRLIVGCGAYGRLHPDPAALEALRARGIEVDVAPTGEAVELFNTADPSRTAAALHLTC